LLCPTNPLRPNPADDEGYGATDYAPVYYTDIDPETGLRNKVTRADGGLVIGNQPIDTISDGTSNTIAIAEDVGRNPNMTMHYADPLGGYRKIYRWAEPDNAIGISLGINNHALPFGGPEACLWTVNNCGPNEEIFSFHGRGAHVLFCDGHIAFLSESIDPRELRKLITRNGGEAVADY
jgi:prepilin-type processing-associated H-X9-DG protein